MQEYKPKRFEIKKFTGFDRSIGLALTRENYGNTKDYYLYLNLWLWSITLVFLRLNNIK